jgi:hypothetical protein
VTEEQQEEGLSKRYATYTSPKAYDKEGDKPIITMKGGKLPCNCLTFVQQQDNSFKLEVDRSKLTLKDKGRHELYITVKDEWHSLFFTKNMYIVSLVINYKKKIVSSGVAERAARI